ncbi:MAG: ornithine cyclodeaminase family protein [Bacteroidota bacterium]
MFDISANQVHQLLDYPQLIQTLRKGFCEEYSVPQRHHHDFPNPTVGKDSTLLLMPAWQVGHYLGVKLVMVSPENSRYDLPSIQGMYFLFDAHKGTSLAQIEAKALTSRRTAAASALAADYLARPDSRRLLIVGTGALSTQIAHAYAAIRPIEEILIWGRNPQKAHQVMEILQKDFSTVRTVTALQNAVPQADIISCVTLSEQALIKGTWLMPGQHIDLIGSYKPNMREADDEVIRRAELFVDTPSAMKESGDLFIPLQSGLIQAKDIEADLFDLCRQKHPGRTEANSITLFKSVGYALEDLVAAVMVYEKLR